jgi:hypothetical protein
MTLGMGELAAGVPAVAWPERPLVVVLLFTSVPLVEVLPQPAISRTAA